MVDSFPFFQKINLRVALYYLFFVLTLLPSVLPFFAYFSASLLDFIAFRCYTILVKKLDMYLLLKTFHYIMEIMCAR